MSLSVASRLYVIGAFWSWLWLSLIRGFRSSLPRLEPVLSGVCLGIGRSWASTIPLSLEMSLWWSRTRKASLTLNRIRFTWRGYSHKLIMFGKLFIFHLILKFIFLHFFHIEGILNITCATLNILVKLQPRVTIGFSTVSVGRGNCNFCITTVGKLTHLIIEKVYTKMQTNPAKKYNFL